jgi:hypothetical protein
MKYAISIIFVFLLFPLMNTVHGIEPILISISSSMDKVIFDGKWTNELEWKESSWESIPSQYGTLHLRTAHQGDFIYILLDTVDDQSIDHISDRAVVCIDGKNDKTISANSNDYCFFTALNGKQGFVYQGGSLLSLNGNFKKISNTEGFIGVGSKSDQNDKYSKIPHTSYEFKIPLNLFDRSNIYGFYVLVFDASTNQYYSWPTGIIPNVASDIPSPSKWGELVSPDKSIPEFNLPLLALIPALCLVIYLTRFLQKPKRG